MSYECEYCGSRFGGEPRVCERCGAARLRRVAAPPPPPVPPAPSPTPPEPKTGPDTAAVIVLVLAAIVAFAGLMSRINPENLCAASMHPVREGRPPAGRVWYTVAGVEARSGPGTEHEVLRRLPPGSELRALPGAEWVYATTSGGDSLGYVPAMSLDSAPPTLGMLRAFSRKDRAALEAELAGRMEVSRDSGVVRYHPVGAPDWRELARQQQHWIQTSQPPVLLRDSASRAALLRPRFVLYGEVEEEGDSLRLVLVPGERTDETWWTQVRFETWGAVKDSAWTGYGPQQLTAGARLTDASPWLRMRFLAVVADSAQHATAWRVARADSVDMLFTSGGCVLKHRVPRADQERLRAVLRLYDLKKAEARR